MSAFLIPFVVAAAATLTLARLAPRIGLVDGPGGPEGGRKVQTRAVPAVGGLALGLALPFAGLELSLGAWAALGLVLAVGLVDDRHPLAPLPKLGLQALALFPLFLAELTLHGPLDALVAYSVGLVALNVANTFDNADGALGTIGGIGLVATGTGGLGMLGGLLGFLPFNLDGRRGRGPTAYLGDGGAFVLALVLTLHPPALAALFIPALDLARLSLHRLELGSRPWIGDRRHLAHGLQTRGLGPRAVGALLGGLSVPGVLGAVLEPRLPGALTLGLALGATLYLVVLRWAPVHEEGLRPVAS